MPLGAGTDVSATPAGTQFLAKIGLAWAVTLNDNLYGGGCPLDSSSTWCHGQVFFTSDGTPAGTQQISGVENVIDLAVAGNSILMNVGGDLWAYTP